MNKIDHIIAFIKEETGAEIVVENSDIDYDIGCTGDDFSELMEKYAKLYKVDMSSYLWYFHHYEEGNNFGNYFFKAPNEYVKHIPVTPKLLLEFAEKGKWALTYPQHTLPKRRYDIIANQIFFLVAIILAIYFWLT